MRHHADDVASFVAETGDGIHGAVGVRLVVQPAIRRGVTQNDLPIRLDRAEDVRRREVVALAMADRNPEYLALARRACEGRIGLLDAEVDVLAAVLQTTISEHRARQQPGLEQNLKAVADAEDGAAALGEPPHLAHDRREARHGACPKVIAVGEAARRDPDAGAPQARVLVPDGSGRWPEPAGRS